MTTRADELVASSDRFADACALSIDRSLVHELAIACGWGARSIAAPLLPSSVSHGVPWGLSIAIERSALELRLFLEPQDHGRFMALAGEHGAELERLTAILDPCPGFRVWYAVALAPALRWHAYVCIPPDRPDAARTALRRAGVHALPALRDRDRISMVSLDLTAAMRVKAYVFAPDASLDELAALHDTALGAIRGDAEQFGRAMLGDPAPRIWWLAALGYTEATTSCALHLGIPRHLDEATATTRIRDLLAHHELPTAAWERIQAPHHFVTFQRRAGAPRVTTYFLPQVAR